MGKRFFFGLTVMILPLLFASATVAGGDPVYPAPLSQVLRVDADGSGLQQVVPAQLARAFGYIDADTTSGKLYWTGFGETAPPPVGFFGATRRADLDGSNLEQVGNGEGSVEVDGAGGKLYYTLGSDCDPCTSVWRSNLNGSNVEQLTAGISFTEIALDVPGGKIYWYDQGNLVAANLDGSGQQILFAVAPYLHSLEFDATNQKLYWISSPPVPDSATLYRANRDGSAQEALASIDAPAQLTLDPAGDRLWWTERDRGTIKQAALDGSGVTTIRSGLDSPGGITYVPGAGQGGGRLYFLGSPQLVYEPVPAASGWGLLATVLLLGASSGAALRRKAGASGRN